MYPELKFLAAIKNMMYLATVSFKKSRRFYTLPKYYTKSQNHTTPILIFACEVNSYLEGEKGNVVVKHDHNVIICSRLDFIE